jgi:hypothetical protein
VGEVVADLLVGGDVPPDEPAVVPTRDERVAGQREGGDVAAVGVQVLRLELLVGEFAFAHLEVGGADKDAIGAGDACDGERDGRPAVILDELQRFGIRCGHGIKWVGVG